MATLCPAAKSQASSVPVWCQVPAKGNGSCSASQQACSAMNKLPNELLVKILSCLDLQQLILAQQVCVRWCSIVDEFFWKLKTSITEHDLSQFASLEVKMRNFIDLMKTLPNVRYYCFPFVEWIHHDRSYREECVDAVHERILELERLMKEKLGQGRVPGHLRAIEFLADLYRSREEKQSSDPKHWPWLQSVDIKASPVESLLAKCRSLIVPYWPPENLYDRTQSILTRAVSAMSQLRELTIDEWVLDSCPSDDDDDGTLSLPTASLSLPARIRIRELGCDLSVDQLTLTVRLRDESMSSASFLQLTNAIAMYMRKGNKIAAFSAALDQLEPSGMILNVSLGTLASEVRVRDLEQALDLKTKVNDQLLILLRRLAYLSVVDSLAVHDSDAGRRFFPVLYKHPLFSRLKHLTLLVSRPSCGQVDDDSSDDAAEAKDVLHIWDSLTQGFLPHQQSLLLDTSGFARKCYIGPPLTTPNLTALPCLSSIEVQAPVSLPHLLSLLDRATNLRRLILDIPAISGTETERLALTKCVLGAIGQKRSLVYLDVNIDVFGRPHPDMLNPCLTYTVVHRSSDAAGQRSSVLVRLKEEVLAALRNLSQLETLDLEFYPVKECFPESDLDMSPLIEDMQRIHVTLPRLRVIKVCDLTWREADGAGRTRDMK